MKTFVTLAASLSLGLAGPASATAPAATAGAEFGPEVSSETSIAPAACYYRYFYVTDGYSYRYY
jgi:hypothetical protein